MHIYISSMGGRLGSLPEVYNKISMVDKAYVIMDHDFKHSGEKKAKDFFNNCLIPCEIIFVDGKKDFRGVVDAVRTIATEYKGRNDVRYSVNLTGGTTLMSSALCYSSFFLGAETYYVMYDKNKEIENKPQDPLDERIIKIPITNVPDVKHLGKTTRKVLDTIIKYYFPINRDDKPDEPLTYHVLMESTGLSRSDIGYHLGVLRKKKIIELKDKEENRNFTEIILTEDGLMIKSWIDIV